MGLAMSDSATIQLFMFLGTRFFRKRRLLGDQNKDRPDSFYFPLEAGIDSPPASHRQYLADPWLKATLIIGVENANSTRV